MLYTTQLADLHYTLFINQLSTTGKIPTEMSMDKKTKYTTHLGWENFDRYIFSKP
uniref:Uncharacterized protein n=1 Tax=Anguilla anguilla TaxID=7936 RepID=A0A0E9TIB2_ANGAN